MICGVLDIEPFLAHYCPEILSLGQAWRKVSEKSSGIQAFDSSPRVSFNLIGISNENAPEPNCRSGTRDGSRSSPNLQVAVPACFEPEPNLSQLGDRESVPGPLESEDSSAHTATRFLSSLTVAGALAGPGLTVLICTSAIGQGNQLRSDRLQRGYWRGVAAVKYNSDALGHRSPSNPNTSGRARN